MSEESEQQDSSKPFYTNGQLNTGKDVIKGKKITTTINKVKLEDSSVTKYSISK